MKKQKRYLAIVGLLGLLSNSASAESCEQIRAQIKAQTGDLPSPEIGILEKLNAHPECRFSATEVYRAAYGDKPMPQRERQDRRANHRDHDDDD